MITQEQIDAQIENLVNENNWPQIAKEGFKTGFKCCLALSLQWIKASDLKMPLGANLPLKIKGEYFTGNFELTEEFGWICYINDNSGGTHIELNEEPEKFNGIEYLYEPKTETDEK